LGVRCANHSGLFPRAPFPQTQIRQASSLAAKKISGHDDTSFFFGMVKPQPGDISIVDKLGTLLMWYDTHLSRLLTNLLSRGRL